MNEDFEQGCGRMVGAIYHRHIHWIPPAAANPCAKSRQISVVRNPPNAHRQT
jgi:hypothetical protein